MLFGAFSYIYFSFKVMIYGVIRKQLNKNIYDTSRLISIPWVRNVHYNEDSV